MGLLPSFPYGGISYKDDISSIGKDLNNSYIPSHVLIPLRFSPQQRNKDIIIHVNEGSFIEEDQLLSSPRGLEGLPVYSSIPGILEKIVEADFPFLGKTEAALIKFQGQFKRQSSQKNIKNWKELSELDILKQLARLGASWENSLSLIQYLKLHLKDNLDYIIFSLIEDSPYSTGRVAFFKERKKEILEGLEILNKILNPSHGIIFAVNDPLLKKEILEDPILSGKSNIRVERLARKYPQNNPKMLIYSLLGIPLSQIKHPLSNGILIANPYQLYHTRQAIYLKQPKTEQILTLTGNALKHTMLIKVRVGTSLKQILDQYNILKEKPAHTVINNPFWGEEIIDFDQPITHQINSLSFLKEKKIKDQKIYPCINCGLCHNICPVGLEPLSIYKAIENQEIKEAEGLGIKNCIECGLCSFSCPSHIKLAETIINTKKRLMSE